MQDLYRSAQQRYLKFCNEKHLFPIPTSENVICYYVSSLASDCQLKHQTIKAYISAIRHPQITEGLSDPFKAEMPRLDYVMREIKRVQGKKGLYSQNPRLPITPDILRKLKAVWSLISASQYQETMLWAASSIGFFGFSPLRRNHCTE